MSTLCDINSLFLARCRYDEMRQGLDLSRDLDRDLDAELSDTVRAIDQKISEMAAPVTALKAARSSQRA